MSLITAPYRPLCRLLLCVVCGVICGAWFPAPFSRLTAQNLIETPQEADSLHRLITTAKHDTVRINAMNELALYLSYWKAQDDSAMVLAREAEKRSERIGYRTGSAGALNVFGVVALANRRFPQAREQFRTALRMHEEQGNKSGMVASLFFIGSTFGSEEKYQEALEWFFKALRMYEELGDKRQVYWMLYLIALQYTKLGRYTLAVEYYLKALRKAEELGDKQNIAAYLWNIGDVLSDGGKYEEALVYHQKALRIWEELEKKEDGREEERKGATARSLVKIGCDYGYLGQYAKAQENLFQALQMYGEKGNKTLRFVCLNFIGYFYNRNGQFKEAQPYLLQSLRLQNEKLGKQNVNPGMNTLNNLAVSYRGQGKYDSALVFARKALAIADSTHFKKSEKEALEELVNIMESLGRPQEALAYYKRYTALKDSLINLESLNKTAELKEGYEAEKREQQITLLNKERALQETEISRRAAVQWFLGGILAVVVAGAIWLGALYRQKNAANKAILRQQALLEDQAHEIHQANTELHQQNEELAALNTEKNELMGIVAHDLKNPIGAVRGFADLIQSGFVEGEQIKEVAEQIYGTAERMLELVKNLLDINRLEQGGKQYQIAAFDIAHIVESTVRQYQSATEAKSIALHFRNESDDSTARADESALMQVLDNLVSNAVKYSPHGKNIDVCLRSSNNTVRVEVRDEGPGISEEDMKKLFGKFARLSARPTGGEHSTGLGLSIVKKMVEAMNGKVWCESEVGKGAMFIVELPSVAKEMIE